MSYFRYSPVRGAELIWQYGCGQRIAKHVTGHGANSNRAQYLAQKSIDTTLKNASHTVTIYLTITQLSKAAATSERKVNI